MKIELAPYIIANQYIKSDLAVFLFNMVRNKMGVYFTIKEAETPIRYFIKTKDNYDRVGDVETHPLWYLSWLCDIWGLHPGFAFFDNVDSLIEYKKLLDPFPESLCAQTRAILESLQKKDAIRLATDISFEINPEEVKRFSFIFLDLYLETIKDDSKVAHTPFKIYGKQKDYLLKEIEKTYLQTGKKEIFLDASKISESYQLNFFEVLLTLENDDYIKIEQLIAKDKNADNGNSASVTISEKMLENINNNNESGNVTINFKESGELIEANRGKIINKYGEDKFAYTICYFLYSNSKNRGEWVHWDEIADYIDGGERSTVENRKKQIYDAIRGINKRAEATIGSKIIENNGENKYKTIT